MKSAKFEAAITETRSSENYFVSTFVDTHRPGEVERKPEGIGENRQRNFGIEVDDILTEHGSHDVTISARRLGVNCRLVLLQAHSKSRFTDICTLARGRLHSRTTVALVVLSVLVHE